MYRIIWFFLNIYEIKKNLLGRHGGAVVSGSANQFWTLMNELKVLH